jgi:hypothetical protein
MTDLVVIVPSRGRPEAARALATAFADTCTADTQLVLALDADDTTLDQYPAGPTQFVGETKSMVEALNGAAAAYADALFGMTPPFALGFMGDDHRPRTRGWDTTYLDTLSAVGTGIVYGNDLLQGRNLPTQCAMTADIVRALGYMAPPALRHMYVDNFWLELGRAADCIRYLPDVIVEHRHPVAGKAEWDEGYRRVNDVAVYSQDEATFRDFLREQMPAAAEKVLALRSVDA